MQPNDFLAPIISDKQAELLELVSERRISVLTGGAGTGKSRCIAALACTFKTVILSAPTGKATRRIVQVWREYNPKVEAFTLHSILGMVTSDTHSTENRKTNNYNIPNNSLLIIDEASMIDIDIMVAVVNAAKY